jgi:hypothetical protein
MVPGVSETIPGKTVIFFLNLNLTLNLNHNLILNRNLKRVFPFDGNPIKTTIKMMIKICITRGPFQRSS